MIVVIPSNRLINLAYLKPLVDSGARFIIVDDSPGSIEPPHPAFSVYNWEDRKRILGTHDEFFPRRNGACRDFGFLIAWRESDQGEAIIALDDDCEVTAPDFATQVEAALSPARRPVLEATGRHLNILDLYKDAPADLFPRGFPYERRLGYERSKTSAEMSDTAPIFNLGLWADAFDINGIDKIDGPEWRHPDAVLETSSVALPRGALVSVCSMNMQFRREVIPAVYQLPMHVPVLPHWVIDRYGDIWGGFILKMLIDRQGDVMSVGAPMIAHRKAGDMVRNIWQEHIAHLVNCEAIELFGEAAESVPATDYLSMMGCFNEALAPIVERSSDLLRPYLRHLIGSISAWCEALA